MKIIDGGVCAALGLRQAVFIAVSAKTAQKLDLALIYSEKVARLPRFTPRI